mmetsp:Transcript_91895/g.163601  ORF Transcript_91895/g.163601 Transcript_91895/m.163601 type:complete len:406 (+) Transcript_91895:46-1263(+)
MPRKKKKAEVPATELKIGAVVEPTSQHQASIICLHGLGDLSTYWAPIIEASKLAMDISGIRWICLEAPRRRLWGEQMSAWFEYITDRSGEDQEDVVNETHVVEVRGALHEMIEAEARHLQEISGKTRAAVFLLGSSQGGCAACDAALTLATDSVAGVAMLRSLVLGSTLHACAETAASASVRRVPLLAVSGNVDDTFLLTLVKRNLAAAKPLVDSEHVVVEGLHHMTSYSSQEMFALLRFIARHLQLEFNSRIGPDALAKALPDERPCDKDWDQMTDGERRLAAQMLGGSRSASAWDNGTAKVWSLSWASLSELQKRAAKSLGFTEASWSERDAASAQDPSCDKSWVDLSDEERALAKRLGINGAKAWDDGTAPVWSKSWRKLENQQRQAAEKLGYTQASWDADH